MAIKVLIVDDQRSVREIIKDYLSDDERLETIGFASNGQEAIEAVEAYRPNIVLMDIEMPVLDGLKATKIISEKFVDTNVLITTVHNDDSYLTSALQVGAKGYLLKNTPAKELINAIYSAHKGYFQLGPGLLEKYLHKVNNAGSNTEELEHLKKVIMQQSDYLETLRNSKNKADSNSENRYRSTQDYLDKQVYILNGRIDKLNRKIISLQQSILLIVLCIGILLVTALIFSI